MSGHGDVSSTLSDLERKLKDLERELAVAGAPAAVPAPEAVPPGPETLHDVVIPAPAPGHVGDPAAVQLVADAQQSLAGLDHQLEGLVRFREQLERSTRELLDEYARLLDALQAPRGADAPAPAPALVAAPPPVVAPAPVPSTVATDTVRFEGQVTVDAGPFTDIATLSAFEQALGDVSGTQDVYVRGFEGSRALIDLVLGEPVALGMELRRAAPVAFTITATTPDHVSITIDGGRHA
ncbi:MAG: hypothetical protein JWN65_3958 [Solirubrobacterales bacterium]|nr:hypothetical protein [Solirubrobacterales bacterium]